MWHAKLRITRNFHFDSVFYGIGLAANENLLGAKSNTKLRGEERHQVKKKKEKTKKREKKKKKKK